MRRLLAMSVRALTLLAVLWTGLRGVATGGQHPEIQVVVDPRIELLAAVQQFNTMYVQMGLITKQEFPYKQAMHEWFAPYADHQAVTLFNEMASTGFNFDAPPTAILHMSKPPELTEEIPFTDYDLRRGGGREKLEAFFSALRDFAKVSDFQGFWDAHQAYYDSIVALPRKEVADGDYASMLENYYRMHQHGFFIIEAPLFHDGGFGPRIAHPSGGYDVYYIGGPNRVEDGIPKFWGAQGPRHAAIHEFSHSFVNPQTDEYAARVDSCSALFAPIEEKMKKMAYGQWATCVNEHVVRAVTTRFVYRFDGQTKGDKQLKAEEDNGFVYIAPLVKALVRFESDSTNYPTFADFYPELLRVFESQQPDSGGE